MTRTEAPSDHRPADRRIRGGRRSRTLTMAVGAALLPTLLAASGCGGPADAAPTDVTVMTWAPTSAGPANHSGMTALATTIGRQVNAKGGLNGRKLKVLTCNEQNTPDGATACARQAVDAHAVAVIGSYSQFGTNFMPNLETAGIPYIGGYGLSAPEFSSPLSYPVAGGLPALIAGSGRQLVEAGCKSVSLIRPDSRVGDSLVGYLTSALKPAGIKVNDIKAPEQSNDYSAYAKQAIGADPKGNCVTSALGAESTGNLLDPYRRLNPKHTQLASVIGSFQQSVVDSTGGDSGPLQNAFATGWFPPETSHVWDGLRAAIHSYADGGTAIDVSDPGVETTWIAYEVFLQAADRVGRNTPLTALSLRDTLDSGDPIQTGGATPTLSWGLTSMLPSADSPRLVNTAVTFQQVQSGRLADQHGGFVDVRWILTGGHP